MTVTPCSRRRLISGHLRQESNLSRKVRIMKTTSLKIASIGMLVLLACISAAAQDIKYNFMPGTDFTKYKTYRWARVPNVQYPDQIIDTQITQAIDTQLSQKGLTKSTGEDSDLVVTYQAAV